MSNEKIKILVVSAVPWNTSNNFGNSYSDIFSKINEFEIANVYLANGSVNDHCVSRAFEISEDMLVHNLINKKNVVGKETAVFDNENVSNYHLGFVQKIKNYGLIHRFSILYMCRDLLWKVGRWKSESLLSFIKDFKPDLIFAPINGSSYPNNIILEISKKFNLPVVGYISDDNYSFKLVNFSPLFWIRRMFIRRSVGKLIKQCKILYVISKKQKIYYDQIFGISSRILTKSFEDRRASVEEKRFCINMVYTGNLGLNRWKSLAKIASVVDSLNKDCEKINLDIYSGTELTKAMKSCLKGKGVQFRGKVPHSRIHGIQKNADVLLHVEATDFIHKWDAMYGFSTKLVDYFSEAKPIFAYGDESQASISYLKEENAAFVATNDVEIENVLKSIVKNPSILEEYAEKSFNCGKKNHDANYFKSMLICDARTVFAEAKRN